MSKRSFSFTVEPQHDEVAEQIMIYQNEADERNFSHFYSAFVLHRNFDQDFNQGEKMMIQNTLHDVVLLMQLDLTRGATMWPQRSLAKQSRQAFLANQTYPKLGENDQLLDTTKKREVAHHRQYLQTLKNATLIGMQIFNAIFNISKYETCLLYANPRLDQSPFIAECFFLSYSQKYLNLPTHIDWNFEIELHPLNYIHQIISAMRHLKDIFMRVSDLCEGLEKQPRHATAATRHIYQLIEASAFAPGFKKDLLEYIQAYIIPIRIFDTRHLFYIFKNILGKHSIYVPNQNVLVEEPDIENEQDFNQKINDFKRSCKRFAHFIDFVPTNARHYASMIQSGIGNRLDPYFHALTTHFPPKSNV